ncbi:Uncharacterised protein [uncultured Eubacterium sp.]|jgi:hypothetical protein|nr:Uncharacterised protein [uncultured Eubacterium sp.]
MTVRELIEKLEECNNPDAIVTIPNEDVFVNGKYEVTNLEVQDYNNTVLIDSDHENLVEEY